LKAFGFFFFTLSFVMLPFVLSSSRLLWCFRWHTKNKKAGNAAKQIGGVHLVKSRARKILKRGK
jgi:hypothetical protein